MSRGGEGKLIFAGYVLLAPQCPCPLIGYFVTSYSPHPSHFWVIVPNLIVKFKKQKNSELFNRDHFESIVTRIFLTQKSENVRPHSGMY